eukprot:412014-Pyramimonas_sp.AAC.1
MYINTTYNCPPLSAAILALPRCPPACSFAAAAAGSPPPWAMARLGQPSGGGGAAEARGSAAPWCPH